ARMESLQTPVPRRPRSVQPDLLLPLPPELDPRGEPHEEGRDGQVGKPNRGDASEQELSESVHEETPGKQGEQEDDEGRLRIPAQARASLRIQPVRDLFG